MIEIILWIAFFASLCGFGFLLYELNLNFKKIYEDSYVTTFIKKWKTCGAILILSLLMLHIIYI